jgi:hypothetical protein
VVPEIFLMWQRRENQLLLSGIELEFPTCPAHTLAAISAKISQLLTRIKQK